MLSWEIIARGRVQGVGFRAHAHRCAVQCSIRGYAKNLWDGSVHIHASGDQAALETFCSLLRSGHHHIVVQDLQVTEVTHAVDYDDFEIR